MQMATVDFKPTVHVTIDACVDNSQFQNRQQKPSQVPILTRLHAGYFTISLSLSSQALLWRILSELNDNYSQEVWQVFRLFPSTALYILWCLALLVQVSLCILYLIKCSFHFDLVKAEFLHYIGVNCLYGPWISWLLLLQSSPIHVSSTIYHVILYWGFVIPVMVLDVKLYGQWLTTERKFLSKLGNPSSHLSVIGNLAAATAAAQMGWKESAVCMFSLGIIHYLVLFVTLYQRLSGSNSFPSLLRPTFFLFFATPSMASLAWKSISGSFDTSSKMLFFLSLFLFTSLACRPALFKKSLKKFDVAWWAYSFTLTFLALASIEYAKEVNDRVASNLMLVLSALSVIIFLGLLVLTALKFDKLPCDSGQLLTLGVEVTKRWPNQSRDIVSIALLRTRPMLSSMLTYTWMKS